MKSANLTSKQRAYVERVAHNLEGLEAVSTGLCPGCDECRSAHGGYTVREFETDSGEPFYSFDATAAPHAPGILHAYAAEELAEEAAREAFAEAWRNGDVASEPSFSWSGCDICGSRLGGDREPWHFLLGGVLHHAEGACVDCIAYLANGDVPDLGPDEDEEEG